MITTRSSILLIVAGMALFGGLMDSNEEAALGGLTLLLWLAIQWFGVQWALRSAGGIVDNITRLIDGDDPEHHTLVVDKEYSIQLKGKLATGLRSFRISIRDAIPAACEIVDGYSAMRLDKQGENQFWLTYKLKPVVCGRMELTGILITISDPNGMFCGQRFVPLRQKLTVLPFLIRPQTTTSVLKTNNLQRILGHHRYMSPGISAELMGIRDYRSGDPPRSIAWKPTARLDKLMSREFESEVPVRATIVCDVGAYQFVGRPGNAVADRVITAVASVARLLLSDRDPVAVVLASERGSTRIPHGHGERQLSRLMHCLLAAADPNPRIEYLSNKQLVRVVFRECYRRFPHLFERRTSFLPVGRTLFKPLRGKHQRMRCRLAPVLCQLLGLPPGHEYRLVYDSKAMRMACESWAREYPITDVPHHDTSPGREQEMRHAAWSNLFSRLIDCRARASDNELIVVVASSPVDPQDGQRLMDVIRVCRASGHRVVFVDAGFPVPSEEVADPLAKKIFHELSQRQAKHDDTSMRDELTALGVRYAKITDPELMENVAIEIQLIRSGRMRGVSRSSFN